jgi:hypothetical protein
VPRVGSYWLDGLQPQVGHEVLWVLRECLSGEVLSAQSLLSAAQEDLARLLQEVRQGLRCFLTGSLPLSFMRLPDYLLLFQQFDIVHAQT